MGGDRAMGLYTHDRRRSVFPFLLVLLVRVERNLDGPRRRQARALPWLGIWPLSGHLRPPLGLLDRSGRLSHRYGLSKGVSSKESSSYEERHTIWSFYPRRFFACL